MFIFLSTVAKSAEELAIEVHRYADPSYPLRYGGELDALRRACADLKEAPYDTGAAARVVALAGAVMRFLDAPPDADAAGARQRELNRLISMLEEAADKDDVSRVPAIVETAMSDSPWTNEAAGRLSKLMNKLGGAAYDTAVKIIGDIGSATIKKMLGI